MLALLIILALLIVLSPFAIIPVLRRAATHAEDDAGDYPPRAVFTAVPEDTPDMVLRNVRGSETH